MERVVRSQWLRGRIGAAGGGERTGLWEKKGKGELRWRGREGWKKKRERTVMEGVELRPGCCCLGEVESEGRETEGAAAAQGVEKKCQPGVAVFGFLGFMFFF